MSHVIVACAAALAALCVVAGRLPVRARPYVVGGCAAALLTLSVFSGGHALAACGFAAGAAVVARGQDTRVMAAAAALVAVVGASLAAEPHATTLLTLLVASVVWLTSGAALALLLDGAGANARAQRAGIFFGIGAALLVASWTRGGAFVPLDGVIDVVATATEDGPSAFADHVHGRAPWLVWWCAACCLAAIVAGVLSRNVAGIVGVALAVAAFAGLALSDPAVAMTSWVSAPGSRVGSATLGDVASLPIGYCAAFSLIAILPLATRSRGDATAAPARIALAGGLWIVAAMLVHAWCWWVGEEATGHLWAVLPLSAGFATVGAALLGAGRGGWGDALLRFGAYGAFAGALVVLLASS